MLRSIFALTWSISKSWYHNIKKLIRYTTKNLGTKLKNTTATAPTTSSSWVSPDDRWDLKWRTELPATLLVIASSHHHCISTQDDYTITSNPTSGVDDSICIWDGLNNVVVWGKVHADCPVEGTLQAIAKREAQNLTSKARNISLFYDD